MGCGSSDPLRTEAVSPWFIKVATIVKLDGGGRWEVGGGDTTEQSVRHFYIGKDEDLDNQP